MRDRLQSRVDHIPLEGSGQEDARLDTLKHVEVHCVETSERIHHHQGTLAFAHGHSIDHADMARSEQEVPKYYVFLVAEQES